MRSIAKALIICIGLMLASLVQAAPLMVTQVRLYALDCGRLEISNLAPFADTGEYDGHPGELMASCFLIVHPKGILLWDTGLGDKYADPPEGTKLPNYTAVVQKTVASQLAELGLSYDDIQYFAFSHAHADHVGNADQLKKAIWIVDTREADWWQSTPTPERVNPALLTAYSSVTIKPIHGDYDVFGDGAVRMLFTPGHTPGHHVLEVNLAHSGTVILSGDLFHSEDNRANRRMPVFNVSRADTLASIDRIEAIAKNTHAKIVIQHSVKSFESLPKYPAYLD